MSLYLFLALLGACLLIGSELDPKRPKFAAFVALLVALAWPIVLGMILRDVVLTGRAQAVAKWKRRRIQA